MDTLRSPIPQGSMGGPTGTGRPPRLSSNLGSFLNGKELDASGSRIFSDEVQRAEERAKLGSGDERLAAQAQERRNIRHEGFGQASQRESSKTKPDREAKDVVLAGAAQQEVPRPQELDPSTKPSSETNADQSSSTQEEVAPRTLPKGSSTTDGKSPAVQASARELQNQPNLTQATAANTAGQVAQQTAPSASVSTTSSEAPGVRAIGSDTPSRSKSAEASAPTPKSRAEEIAEAAEILRQIKVAATSGSRRISVELSPLTLGRVQIRVGLRPKGVDAVVEADKPATYAALERQVPELRALLSEVTGGRDVTLTLLGGEGQEQRTQQDGSRREFAAPKPLGTNITTNSTPAPRAQSAAAPMSTAAIDTYA